MLHLTEYISFKKSEYEEYELDTTCTKHIIAFGVREDIGQRYKWRKKMQPLIMAYRADCSYLCTATDWSIANLNVRIAMIGYISQMFEKF